VAHLRAALDRAPVPAGGRDLTHERLGDALARPQRQPVAERIGELQVVRHRQNQLRGRDTGGLAPTGCPERRHEQVQRGVARERSIAAARGWPSPTGGPGRHTQPQVGRPATRVGACRIWASTGRACQNSSGRLNGRSSSPSTMIAFHRPLPSCPADGPPRRPDLMVARHPMGPSPAGGAADRPHSSAAFHEPGFGLVVLDVVPGRSATARSPRHSARHSGRRTRPRSR
jgi:hypothetical protein